MDKLVRLDCGKVQTAVIESWEEIEWKDTPSHEVVPALIEIVSDLQRRILELEKWRRNATAP